MATETPTTDPRRHAPATLRNRAPILAVLRPVLPQTGLLLEVASGSGEHAAYMAPLLPGTLEWQPTEADAAALPGIDAHARDAGSGRIRPALVLDVTRAEWPVGRADAVLCCNMIHIAPWRATEGLLAGAARILGTGAPLILYGPFRRAGAHTAPSNEAFDRSLRTQDPRWGVRCLDTEVLPAARRMGFQLDDLAAMPANNLTVVLRRG
ncbi:MAG: DUF938 domain-containing protein [Alphaproteobacteria bacterium]|nr:DUF938 domain-containing protein [Alphaproteobacteria bacterium]